MRTIRLYLSANPACLLSRQLLGANRSSAKLAAFAKGFHLPVNSVLSLSKRQLNARHVRPARNRTGWRAKVWLVACLAVLVLLAYDDARGEPGAQGAVAPTNVTLPPLDPALLGKPL